MSKFPGMVSQNITTMQVEYPIKATAAMASQPDDMAGAVAHS
jgi:hypothetical protein